jgi:CheY-like chemotaxis protein
VTIARLADRRNDHAPPFRSRARMTRNVGYSLPQRRVARAIMSSIDRSILVVDDDPTFRRLARLLLTNQGFVVVAEAGSVADAVSTARRVQPSAALVDVELPDGDGFELAGRLSAMPWSPRIVVTSVQSGADFTTEARRVGAEAFVLKADLARAPLRSWLDAQ